MPLLNRCDEKADRMDHVFTWYRDGSETSYSCKFVTKSIHSPALKKPMAHSAWGSEACLRYEWEIQQGLEL